MVVEIILDLFITVFAYLLVPMIFIFLKKRLTLPKIKKIVIINGVSVCLLFIIVRAVMEITQKASFAVLLWSYVAYWLMKKNLLVSEEQSDSSNETSNDMGSRITQMPIGKKDEFCFLKKKATNESSSKQAVSEENGIVYGNTVNSKALLKRAFLFLEDGEFDRADRYLEKVLDQEPENAMAYVGKLMVVFRVNVQDDLRNLPNTFEDNTNFLKAFRYADDTLRNTLSLYIKHIIKRNEATRLEEIYNRGIYLMSSAKSEGEYKNAAEIFKNISEYKDSQLHMNTCLKKAEISKKELIFSIAKSKLDKDNISCYQEAIELFTSIIGWKNSNELIVFCRQRIEELKLQFEKERLEKEIKNKRNKKISVIIASFIFILVAVVITLDNIIIPNYKYNEAKSLMVDGNYTKAISTFNEIEFYKDSTDLIKECNYCIAMILYESKQYSNAIQLFEKLNGYRDSNTMTSKCNTILEKYADAIRMMKSENYDDAILIFRELDGYKDSKAKIDECNRKIVMKSKYNTALSFMNVGYYEKAVSLFEEIIEYKDSLNKIGECYDEIIVLKNKNNEYSKALSLMDAEKYEDAISAFEVLNGYKDSLDKINECKEAIRDIKYNNAVVLMNDGDYYEAYVIFKYLENYRDSVQKIREIEKITVQASYKEQIQNCQVGDYIQFGSYEQDNNISNGQEKIEWKVLAKKGTRILVISKHLLDFQQYNASYSNVTWEECSVRNWLNGVFFNNSFSDIEKDMIPTIMVNADKNLKYTTNPGYATHDKIFLLSLMEIKKYFSEKGEMLCYETAFTKAKGYNKESGWALRTPGCIQSTVVYILSSGEVSEYGTFADNYFAIRPAMWIDIDGI